jgi:hypothetical protein
MPDIRPVNYIHRTVLKKELSDHPYSEAKEEAQIDPAQPTEITEVRNVCQPTGNANASTLVQSPQEDDLYGKTDSRLARRPPGNLPGTAKFIGNIDLLHSDRYRCCG